MQISRFKSKYGDEWVFEYDPSEDKAIVRGSDIGWESYPVIEGVAFQLNMSLDEEEWLLESWSRLVTERSGNPLYGWKNTELETRDGVCQLTNGFCPICLEQKIEYQNHHCLWRSRGGSDATNNLLRICGSCHALVHWGSVEDRAPKSQACLYHQFMHFGVEVLVDSYRERGASKLKEHYPQFVRVACTYTSLDSATREREAEIVKQHSRLCYIFYRDMGLGKWSWHEEQERYGGMNTD